MRLKSTAAALAMLLALPAYAQDLEIVWADDSSSDVTYDPRVTQSRHEEQVIVQLFDQLVAADSDGTLHPGLATEWEVAPDNSSVTLKLRDGVTFHDGTPFNADAVKFTFDSIVDPATGSQGAVDILGPYESTEVLGPLEVRVNYTRPFPNAVASFTESELSPVSPTAVQALGNGGFAQAPVGTGPFRFVQWDQGSQVILERNEDYAWAPEFYESDGPSQVARIVHKFIPNAATRIAALDAGEATITDRTPPLDMRRLGDTDGFETLVGVASGVPFSLTFNISKGPLQDIKVRQAIFHAVDRSALAGNLFFGIVGPAYGPISSATPGYWPDVEGYYPYDPAKAAALLDEAGWTMGAGGVRAKDGQPLSLYYPALLEPAAAVALQAELKKVGIDLVVENVTKARQDELIFANEYDVLGLQWVYNSPTVLRIPFTSENIPEPGKFKFNWMRWANPDFDALLDKAGLATSEEEMSAAYADAQKLIMDDAIFMALFDQVQTIAHSDEITGLHFAPGNWQVRLYDVRAAE